MKNKGMKLTAIVAAVAFGAILVLPYVVDIDRFRPQLESSLKSALNREVHIGHMQISLLAGGATVDQIAVADDPAFSSGTFLQAKSLGVGISFLSLIFSRSLHVTSLTLDQPQMMAIQSPEGTWNFSSLGSSSDSASFSGAAASTPSSVVLDRLKISNATIELAPGESASQHITLKNIDVDLKNVSLDTAMSFVLSAHTGAGKLQIEGDAGPVNHADPNQTPFHATIKADKADLAQIASLGSSASLAGLLNLDATVNSDGSTIHSEGKLSADHLRLARSANPASQPIALQYATDYVVAEKMGVVRNSEILAGRSTASLSGTYDARGKNVAVHLKLTGHQLPLGSITGLLPALGIALPGGSELRGGTVSANLSFDGPVNRLVTSGSAKIANAHLAGFDLGSKLSSLPGMSALKGSMDIPIINLSSRLRVSPESTQISKFDGQFEGIGNITGDGEVKADDHLQFKMVAHVSKNGLVRFGLNHVGLSNMPNDFPFEVIGTTSVPLIIPDLSGMAKNTTKAVAANAGKSVVKKLTASLTNSGAEPEPAHTKKGGFFHKLFGRKDKQASAANSMQMAGQRSKY
jgi:AsmA protein